MKINLVQGGIFPIKDNTQDNSTGFNVSGTFQGEGKLTGTPCLFIRTSACNLRCSWLGINGLGSPCDTPYSSHKPEKNPMEVSDIIQIVKDNTLSQNIKYVVISGGEPTMQIEPLLELVQGLKQEGYHITIESNGTIYNEELAKTVDLMSISPKLSTSTPWEANLKGTGLTYNKNWAEKHERLRINIETLQGYIFNSLDYQLKFVVESEKDILEIENILNRLEGVDSTNVCLMPEGVDVDTLNTRTKWIAEQALKRGWRFTPRLHVMMFGKNRFV